MKRIKIKKDYSPILINSKTKFALFLVPLIIRSIQFILLRLYNKPPQHLNILHISRNMPPRQNKIIRYLWKYFKID